MSFRPSPSSVSPASARRRVRLKPVAHAIALLAIAGGMAGTAHAQRAFSAGWMAQKNMAQSAAAATGRMPNGQPASMFTSPQAQQQRASQELQRSLGNLNLAAQGIAAQQAAQAAARRAAQADASVPDGLAEGGLRIDSASLTAGWLNAERPQQSTSADGRTNVAIRQTGDRAILNWETFNVGKGTTVEFQQQKDWAVLNRVNDPQARPSRIQGQIKAEGTVLIANRNGVVFSGTSQVDTRNLVAAAANIGDAQFQKNGIYGAQAGGQPLPSFTDALGKVEVQPGARITTRPPASVTQGGGYVLLMGAEVHNAGEIVTPRGQTLLAAGDSFIIRKGAGTEGNAFSTTRGNEVAPRFTPESTAGLVRNSGLVVAAEGDITLTGRDVRQDGVALATTTVNTRGTVHLLNAASDAKGRVTIGRNAVTAVLLDANAGATALDTQREALIKESADLDRLRTVAAANAFDNLSRLQDRRDLSRIEIVSGGDVNFEGDSLTLATGGQVAVSAKRRAFVARNAQLDVSGAVGVSVAMEANNIQVNIQGNEQRDAPLNRDTGNLNNANVWIDRRRLSYVPAKQGVYDKDRWYTAGGLLEVGGYLGNQPHSLGEWMAQGGTVVLGGAEVVTQRGSAINLSGGTLNVRTGYLNQSWLKGSDGQLYRLDRAPADVVFDGLYRGFEDAHVRWGKKNTGYYYNPLIGPQRQLENGYTVGRDAGRLVVSAPTAVLEGDIEVKVFQGVRQTQARGPAQDGYLQSQTAVAQPGTLALRRVGGVGADGAFDIRVRIGEVADISDDIAADSSAPLPQARIGTALIDAARLGGFGLGGLEIASVGEVSVERPLRLADGGRLEIMAALTRIDADLTARSGDIVIGNVAPVMTATNPVPGQLLQRDGTAQFVLGEGVKLDLRGLWTNQQLDRGTETGVAFVDGGSLSVRMVQGGIALGRGSLVDVSSGATLARDGRLAGGRGGDVSLLAGASLNDVSPTANPGSAVLRLDGELRAQGVLGGGTLTLQSPGNIVFGHDAVLAGGVLAPDTPAPAPIVLARDVHLAVGDRLPVTTVTALSVSVQDFQLPFALNPTNAAPIATGAAWTVPAGTGVYTAQGYQAAGTLLPAGTRINSFASQIPAGTVLPSAVFPQGIPVSGYNLVQQAGEAAVIPVTYAAGRIIERGARFAEQVAFEPAQRIAPGLLRSGFSSYRLTSFSGIRIAEGELLRPEVPVLRATAAAPDVETGADPARALESWLPPLYRENPGKRRLTQREGARLQLHGSTLELARGAGIEVDAGRQVRLLAEGQLTIEGRVAAPGGDILLNTAATRGPTNPQLAPLGTSIWIGGDAVLDVAGRAHTAIDSEGLRYGIAPNGGSIRIGMEDFTRADRDFLKTTGAHVIVRPGARLDASGASAEIDIPAGNAPPAAARTQRLAGDGGLIRIGSSRGIFNDGLLRAAAGGEGAAGGTLNLVLENPLNMNDRVQVLSIAQDRVASGAAADLRPGVADASLVDARARTSAEEIRAGGFGTLDLWSRDVFSFEGDVNLRLPESLMLHRGVLSVSAATPRAQVSLAAPHVLLDGKVDIELSPGEFVSGLNLDNQYGRLLSSARNEGRLAIEADLLDVRNKNFLGAAGASLRRVELGGGAYRFDASPQDFHGFDTTTLYSRGDLRLTNGLVASGGDMTVTAAQIYPTTGATGELRVGYRVSPERHNFYDADRTLTLRSTGGPGELPAVPSSVFGTLTLAAAKIDQGGVLRAPLGTILFGVKPVVGTGAASERSLMFDVLLRDGSLTSTSAAGLTLPYGGTVDGINYVYNGQAVEFLPLAAAAGRPAIYSEMFVRPGVVFGQVQLTAQPGSVLDISGGGTLTGAGFFTGRGGSVDVLRTPLVNANPAYGFSSQGAGVYAIVPGFSGAYAPVSPDAGAGAPRVGQQITLTAAAGGLPAGTYTLMPSTYALLPGAWRIELGAQGIAEQFGALRASGSVRTSGYLGIANTPVRDALPTAVTLTSGQAVRSLSQYNETSYADFALAKAASFDSVRPRLERDAQSLHIDFGTATGKAMSFEGTVRAQRASGGLDGNVFLTGQRSMEVLAPGAAGTPGFVSLDAAQLSAFDAGALIVGGVYGLRDVYVTVGQGAIPVGPHVVFTAAGLDNVVVRDGARLAAGQIFLTGRNVRVEGGALLDTSRSTTASFDSSTGYVYLDSASNGANAVLTVGNGVFNFAPPQGDASPLLGTITVDNGAMLRTRGTIGFLSSGPVVLGDAQINARYLNMTAPSIHVGTQASFAEAEAQGVLGSGVRLSQHMLERLLRPSVPGQTPIEQLTLTAGNSLNFFGSVDLDLRAAQGSDRADAVLSLNTPAIYGWGTAGDSARIAADTLIWNGLSVGDGGPTSPFASRAPGAQTPGGAGTGAGRLTLDARRIEFGYGPLARTQDQVALDRLALGFSGVALNATERITANHRGTLSVYRQGRDAATYAGGDLTLATPLLTGESGSFMAYRAGGAVSAAAPTGMASSNPAGIDTLGAELRLAGRSVALDTAVALPSGRLVLEAEQGIRLGDAAAIDLSGRAIRFFDVTRHSSGGDLVMEATNGAIEQAAASRIDVSAAGKPAGAIRITATGADGRVNLAGRILGASPVAREAGSIDIRARSLDDFAGLNQRLNEGGVFGGRGFVVKTGDLAIGNELRANRIEVSVDGGSLTVNGRIDASGEDVGTIRLAARDSLLLAQGAVLDAHGTRLAVDGRGQAIEASNRGQVELASAAGTVRLMPGATIDLRSADDVARGRLEINAPRTGPGDVAVDAAAGVTVRGAGSFAVNAFARYMPEGGLIDQAYLDTLHADSSAFIDAANASGATRARLAGLRAYGDAFHLRPGVEIRSDGDLTVSRDLDFSGYRYGPGADAALRGSGEPGVVVLRAGGNLIVNGSISDGFAPPPATPDDAGWTNRPDGQGRMMAVADMLAPGMRSWSMRLVGGADLGAADSRTLAAKSRLGEGGDVLLDDPHLAGVEGGYPGEAFSVIRTGTGYLDVLAGGDYRQNSLFGVYTAGTQIAGSEAWDTGRAQFGDGTVLGAWNPGYEATLNARRMYFTQGGGDLLLAAQGDVRGRVAADTAILRSSNEIGRWLWRQGGGELGQRAAWGVNFGQYRMDGLAGAIELVGFNGIGTLGGGNLTVRAGGDAGSTSHVSASDPSATTSGLDLVVAASGRVDAAGALLQAGGGRLSYEVGGRINTGLDIGSIPITTGQIVNLRGDTRVEAGSIGMTLEAGYGLKLDRDPRAVDVRAPRDRFGYGALGLVVGDGTIAVDTRGDLIAVTTRDAGRVPLRGGETQAAVAGTEGAAATSFTLWTERSGLELFSAGGDIMQGRSPTFDTAAIRYDPGRFSAIAANGSITTDITLAPSRLGRLELLAGNSIFGGSAMSSGSMDSMATPLRPLWLLGALPVGMSERYASNFYADFNARSFEADLYENLFDGSVLFGHGPDRATALYAGAGEPIRMYAARGDVVASTGRRTDRYESVVLLESFYIAARPVQMRAGRDILADGFILNNDPGDISVVRAGRDVLDTTLDIAGPGLFEVGAGRNIQQGISGSGGTSTLRSIGPVIEGDTREGAAIVLMAGMGARGPDYAGFAARYFDAANLADAAAPLADQPGKVAKTYEQRLLAWMQERFGYTGAAEGALAAFRALPEEQQGVLAREVFYEELRQGGREYNDADSRRAGSYLRGRNAIAALLPALDAEGNAVGRGGSITFQTAAGVHTDFGGGIQVLVPGGGLTLGANGVAPPPSTGLLTQGRGDIEIYTRDSVLLGLSRIFTTFGGGVLAWSAEGDINAGRGAKTTVVYTPPKRDYDALGNVKLSPNVPSTGAGIATLAPIAEVPAGDVDLIAPLGTIDAGEAGIRVSGNVNLAALHVVNAANIQVKGESSGLPTVAAVNVGALTNASAAASQASAAAQDVMQRERNAARQALPSVFTVRVLGFGNEPLPGSGAGSTAPREDARTGDRTGYRNGSAVQVLGDAAMGASERNQLTPAERRSLGL